MSGPVVPSPEPEAGAGLDQISEVLLRRARLDADRIRAEANAAADAELARARTEAAGTLTAARVAGTTEVAASADARLAQARRRAREIVLAARKEAYEELRRRVLAAVAARTGDPVVIERLRRLAATRAGPGARTEPASGGGVVAVAPDRRADCSASSLAEHAVDLLGPEVERLWVS